MLTVIVPSYNHASYVESCILGALNVSGARIVVIDDGSTDETVEVVQALIRAHDGRDLRLIKKSNSGIVSSLNMGLSIADTEFFYLVASDDIPDAEGILKCMNILRSDNDLKFCIGGAIAFYDEDVDGGVAVYGEAQHNFLSLDPEMRADEAVFNYPAPLLLQSTVFRTSALKDIGGWSPEIKLDDYPMFVKLLARFPKLDKDFVYAPNVNVVKYRQHLNNSYRNLPGLYAMVSQAIRHISSPPKSDYGVAKSLAYYSLVALKSRRFKFLMEMLKDSSLKVSILSLYYAVSIIFARLLAFIRALFR